VTAIVDGPQEATLLWAGEHLLGAGYEFARPLTAVVNGQRGCWTERVQVVRSRALAQRQEATLEKHLVAAEAALSALTPAPGRGKRQIRDEAAMQTAVAAVLERYEVAGLLTARWERHETAVSRYVGRGRGGRHRPTRTEIGVRYVLTDIECNEPAIAARRHRLGWRVQVTSAPADQLSLTEAMVHYRKGWVLERDFHVVKDFPLGLSPLFVW